MFSNIEMNRPTPEYLTMGTMTLLVERFGACTPTIIDEAKRRVKDETFYLWVWVPGLLMQIGHLCLAEGWNNATAIVCLSFAILFAVWIVKACRDLIGARYIRDIMQEGMDITRTGGRRVPPTPSRDVFTWWWQESLADLRRTVDARAAS